jgi:hypothetical protein
MRLIRKCELHVFYDCGHWAMIERKDEFESTTRAFLLRDVRAVLRVCCVTFPVRCAARRVGSVAASCCYLGSRRDRA